MPISFSQFIREAKTARVNWSKSEMSIEDAAKHVASHCKAMKGFVEAGKLLYRGDYIDEPVLVDTTGSKRVSRDTKNLYQLMMDLQADELGISPRSSSLIFSTSRSTASTYGKVNLIFPYDGSKISFVEKSDFFSVMVPKPINASITAFDSCLSSFLQVTGYSASSYESVDEINRHLSKFSAVQLALYFVSAYDMTVRDVLKHMADKDMTFKNGEAKDKFVGLEYPGSPSSAHSRIVEVENLIKDKSIQYSSGLLKTFEDIFAKNPQERFNTMAKTIFRAGDFPIAAQTIGKDFNHKIVDEEVTKECWFTGKAVIIPGQIKDVHPFLVELEKNGWKIHKSLYAYYDLEKLRGINVKAL